MVSFAALLLRFSPWLVLILLATSIPSFIAETRFSEQGFRLLTYRAPETRQINYLSRLLTEDSAAKEIKLFNLGKTLLGRYMTLFDKFFQEDKSLAVKRAVVGFSLGIVATLGFYGSYAWIVWHTVLGQNFPRRHDALFEYFPSGAIDVPVHLGRSRQHLRE